MTIISSTAGGVSPSEYGPHERMQQAWQWLEAQRNSAPDGADIWHIRHKASTDASYLTRLLSTLQAGEYRLSPMQLHGEGDNRMAIWGAQDALVLKWVALSIGGQLPLHPACEHVKGHGGGKLSIQRLHGLLTSAASETTDTTATTETTTQKKTTGYRRVCRTDIRGYYRNINRDTLYAQVKRHVGDPVMLSLVHQYLHYTVEDGGTFHTPGKGISRGCALSPLMGALHLYDMDAHFSAQKGIHYARYMDDVIILAKTRWSLRRHTKRLMQWFKDYGFEAHPDKTQIGKTEKGFDWMGVWLTHEGVTDVAPRAKANHRDKVRRLYERLARVPDWLRHRRQRQVHARVSKYRTRWNIWAGALLMLSSGLTPVHATRGPLVVLGGTLPLGYLHADLHATGSNSAFFTYGPIIPGPCITTNDSAGSCAGTIYTRNGLTPTVSPPAGMGVSQAFQVASMPNLYLAIAGSITVRRWLTNGATSNPTRTPCGYGYSAPPGAPGHWAVDPSTGCGNKTVSDGTADVFSAQLSPTSGDRWIVTGDPGSPAPQSISYDLDVRPFANGPLSPGSTLISGLSLVNKDGVGNGAPNAPLDYPTAIIVSGLSCTLATTGSLSDGSVNLGTVSGSPVSSPGPVPGTPATVVGGTSLLGTVQSACSGTNSSDASAATRIGLTMSANGDSTIDDGFKIKSNTDAGYYLSITTNGAGSASACTGTNAIRTDAATLLDSYAPSAAGRNGQPYPLYATVCNTGVAPTVGAHQATVTLSWVNY